MPGWEVLPVSAGAYAPALALHQARLNPRPPGRRGAGTGVKAGGRQPGWARGATSIWPRSPVLWLCAQATEQQDQAWGPWWESPAAEGSCSGQGGGMSPGGGCLCPPVLLRPRRVAATLHRAQAPGCGSRCLGTPRGWGEGRRWWRCSRSCVETPKGQITDLSKSVFRLAFSKACFPWRFGV